MKLRCYNPNHKGYANYGGRGIRIAEDWYDDFQLFAMQMGDKPSPKHTLDRVDNNWHYCAENCRWTTWKEQCKSKRTRKRYKDSKGYRYCPNRDYYRIAICVGGKKLDFGIVKTEAEAKQCADAIYSLVHPRS